jgi:poly-gamma-glutamate capsule biosynthesis protein CapA/YwtB (metallophosphatase superfamily)
MRAFFDRQSSIVNRQFLVDSTPYFLVLALTLLGAGLARIPFSRPKPTVAVVATAPKERTLLFVGDIMLARSVGALMEARHDWDYPFRKVAPTLRAADLVFGNLECPVSDTGHNLHHLYSFRADPRAIEGLKYAGFRVLSVANNHMDDWDRPALLDTLQRLRAAGLVPVGAGANLGEAHSPVFVTCPPDSYCRSLAERDPKTETRKSNLVNGAPLVGRGDFRSSSFDFRSLRIAFLAYVDVEPKDAAASLDRAGVAWLDPDRVLADIRFVRHLADLVIVSVHWGVEYAPRPLKEQVQWAHEMIDAGADLVVGGHPHVVQPLEEYHGHWIAYSLGNFVFDQKWPITHHGFMLKLTVSGKQITRVTPVPITIDRAMQAEIPERSARKVAGGRP